MNLHIPVAVDEVKCDKGWAVFLCLPEDAVCNPQLARSQQLGRSERIPEIEGSTWVLGEHYLYHSMRCHQQCVLG